MCERWDLLAPKTHLSSGTLCPHTHRISGSVQSTHSERGRRRSSARIDSSGKERPPYSTPRDAQALIGVLHCRTLSTPRASRGCRNSRRNGRCQTAKTHVPSVNPDSCELERPLQAHCIHELIFGAHVNSNFPRFPPSTNG